MLQGYIGQRQLKNLRWESVVLVVGLCGSLEVSHRVAWRVAVIAVPGDLNRYKLNKGLSMAGYYLILCSTYLETGGL